MDESLNGYARLAAAIGSSGASALNGAGGANEFVSLAMKFLPRLLENVEDRDAVAAQQKETFSALRKHVLLLRRDLRDLMQSHAEAIEELRRMRKLQASMVAHLARVQIMELPRDEEEELGEEDLDEFANAPPPRRGNLRRGSREG